MEGGAGGIAAAAESGEAAQSRDRDAEGVSGEGDRSRADGVLKLRNLAPPIQERLLFLEGAAGAIHERALRRVAQSVNWEEQPRRLEELVA